MATPWKSFMQGFTDTIHNLFKKKYMRDKGSI